MNGLSGIPGSWEIVEFGSILNGGTRNGVYKPKQFHGRGTKIVNMGELFAYPRLRSVEMRRVELTQDERSRFEISTGDLLFARRSLVAEGAGKCCIVMEASEPTTFESSLIRAKPKVDRADSLFLFYLFNSPRGVHLLDTILRQVAVSGITGSDLSRLKIPLPPLSEQRAIAHVLGTLDDKIELNRRMNETLEAMARALFKSWFLDFDPVRAKMEGRQPVGMDAETAALFPSRLVESEIGEVPEGWKMKQLGEVADLSWGDTNTTKASYVEDGYAAYSASGQDGTLPYYDFDRTGVILSAIGANCGSTWLARGKWSCIKNTIRFWATDSNVSTEFLFHATFGKDNWPVRGSAQPFISQGDARSVPILVPQKVGDLFGKVVEPLYARKDANTSESRTLAAVRDALLPKLMSGEVRVGEVVG